MENSQKVIEKLKELVDALVEDNEQLCDELEALYSQLNASINKEYDC